MKSFATQQELQLKNSIFPYCSPQLVPLSFRYGDRTIHGIPASFSVAVEQQAQGDHILQHIITAKDNKGLAIRMECTEYTDFPATEWIAYFTNEGSESTDLISDIRIGGVLPLQAQQLCHGNGDNCEDDGYQWYTDPLTKAFTISPDDGTSCNGAFPYMRLLGQDFGVNLAIGWTGKWVAEISPAENGVNLRIGQARCSMRIKPGETMRAPRLSCVAYLGDETRGRNMWRRWYFNHIMPPVKPMCCMHYFQEGGWAEFTGATEQGQLEAIDRYLENGIHPDVLWMDAGWYPCDHKWVRLGDWRPDPERFPRGLAPIGEKCAQEGIDFLLWFEPERILDGCPLVQAHPEWMLRAIDADGNAETYLLVDLGNPECFHYMVDLIDKIIKESGVKIYRQDFNFDPYPRWVQNEAADRIGALENLHIQGYYRLWDTLRQRNPGLLIDSCSSGGRRNDLETMRRAVTLHYTDIGYGRHPTKQLQHRRMFEWIPYFRAHNMSWDCPKTGEYRGREPAEGYCADSDKYAFYAALTPALTDMLDHRDSEKRFALSRQMQPIWRKAAQLMLSCDYYPLTQCRESREDFYAMAFYSPEDGKGFLNVVSNNNNPQSQFIAVLDMLDRDSVYTLTEAESGSTRQLTGAQLAAGLAVDLPKRSGVIFFIEMKC